MVLLGKRLIILIIFQEEKYGVKTMPRVYVFLFFFFFKQCNDNTNREAINVLET